MSMGTRVRLTCSSTRSTKTSPADRSVCGHPLSEAACYDTTLISGQVDPARPWRRAGDVPLSRAAASIKARRPASSGGKDPAMKFNTAMTSAVIPGLIAGVIYFVIAFATGASATASIIGGIVVAAIAIAIGLIFRAIFKRSAASRRV